MSAPNDGDDEDERTNIDAPAVDSLTFPEDTSAGAPPVARTTTDTKTAVVPAPPVGRTTTDTKTAVSPAPPVARTTTDTKTAVSPAPPASRTATETNPPVAGSPPSVSRTASDSDPPIAPPKPSLAAVPAIPRPDHPSQPAISRTLTPIPTPPAVARTKTPLPGALLPPPAIARTKTPLPAAPFTPPAIARTTTPSPSTQPPPTIARTTTPQAAGDDASGQPAIARTKTPRTKMPALGPVITPDTDDASAESPPAIARTMTPRTKIPALGPASTPVPGDVAPPTAIARTKTPVPADVASTRPPPASAGTKAAVADAAPPPSIARTKTPVPADVASTRPPPASAGTKAAVADAAPPPAIARTKTPAPADSAKMAVADAASTQPRPAIARTKTPVPADVASTQPQPAATARTKTPLPGMPLTKTPVPADAREKTPVPTAPGASASEAARERTKTPAPGQPSTPPATAHRETTPVPAAPRENTQVPTAPRDKAPVPTAPRDKTPVPTKPSDRAQTPVPAAPGRSHRVSTQPPATGARARALRISSGRIEDARSDATVAIPKVEPWLHRIVRIAPWLIIAAPALFQVFLLSTAISGRLLYPYDLEWMEGGMLHHAQRIHGGLGIYVEPSVEFIPYLYTPLYPSLLALFGGAFGMSYTLGRAFSVIALIGIAVVAAVSIANPRHEHARRAPAYGGVVIALGLFAAAYPFMEGWYDLVRADTFFLFMVTAAIAGLPRWAATGTGLRGHGRVAAGAVLLALAFFCKQTGIIYVAFGGLIVLVVAWRRVPVYILMAGLIGLGGTWLLQRTTDGWFWVYIQKIHAAHDFNWDRFWKSFENILWHFPAMTIVIAAALIVVLVTVIWRRKLPRATHPLLLWSATFVVSTLLGAIGWGTEFAHFNAYMPAFLHGALAAGAAIPAIYGCGRLLHGRRRGSETVSSLLALAAAAPLALACWQNRWDPKKYMPTAHDVAAGDRLIERIRGLEGDVWMPSHPWYLVLAGKSPRVHRMGVRDVTWRQPRTIDGLREALQHHAFAALVLDGNDIHNAEPATIGMVNASYRAAFKLPADERPRVFTGARVSPDSIWLPAIPAQPPAGTPVLFDFEQTAWDGWTLSGVAWGPRPETELAGHGLLIGATGRTYATSMHGGDVSTGRITSPAFVVDGVLSIKLGGGTDATKLRVELWVGGAIVATASVPPPGGETLRTVTLDPGVSRGAEATLVFVDDSPAGHLDVDDVWMTPYATAGDRR